MAIVSTDGTWDPARCGHGSATAMAFFRSDVWRYCVRKNGHEGECVFAPSRRQLGRLDEIGKSLLDHKASIVRLEAQIRELEIERQGIADSIAAAEVARGR